MLPAASEITFESRGRSLLAGDALIGADVRSKQTKSGHFDLENDGSPLTVIQLNGGGPRPQTLSSLKARHLVTKRPKKKLSHLYFGPVGGGERQDLIRQPRPSASFVERRQFKNAFADQLFPNVIKNGF